MPEQITAFTFHQTPEQHGTSLLFDNEVIYSLAIEGNTIYAGGGYAFHLSTNGGTNWSQTSFQEICLALVLSGNRLYAGTYNGVFYTTNGAATWEQTSLNGQSVRTLLVNGNTLIAGTDFSGVYVSTNSGTNWTHTSLDTVSIYSLLLKEIIFVQVLTNTEYLFLMTMVRTG
ncbi:MAG: hypothetical protein IPL67_17905 [Ignavibacteria bacterium]|nr:hypothetical protein [Ignavibacteria bacterium]